MSKSIQKLKQIYNTLFYETPCPEGEVEKMEEALKVSFPEDFKEICKFYSGGGTMGYEETFGFFSAIDDDYSIVGSSLEYRDKLGLPHKYVMLDESDASATLFDTEENKVFTFSIEDFTNLCAKRPLLYEYQEYASFADYFEHLLEEEIAHPNDSLYEKNKLS